MIILVSSFSLEMHRFDFHSFSKNSFEDFHDIQMVATFELKSQGCIYTVSVNSHTGSISRSHRNRNGRSKCSITTVQYRTYSLLARSPVLLACAQDGNLYFFRLSISCLWIPNPIEWLPYILILTNHVGCTALLWRSKDI